MDSNKSRLLLRLLLVVGPVLAATTLIPAADARETGRCVSIEVQQSVRMPDGSLHPAGSLTLCHTIRYSPVSSLHETYVNGQPLGMLRSRTRTSEIGNEAPAIVYFNRGPDGRLELWGYVVPARDVSVTYLFGPRTDAPKLARAKKKQRNRDVMTSPSLQPDLVAVAAPSP